MDFNVVVTGRNLEITERIQTYIDKKMQKLDRLLNDIDSVKANISFAKSARQSTDRHIAEITVHGKGYILRAEESGADVFSALDSAMERLLRQIERFKGKRSHTQREPEFSTEKEPEQETKTQKPAIVRRKYFDLVPMDEMEAIEQMEMLGHENFFIFQNVNTNTINVLYMRRDGSYGIIEPRME